MAIIQAAVGDNVRVFCEDADLADVWAFINHHMTGASAMRPIVLRDDSGATIGELWDCSLYCAHWESPEKMRSYLDLAGFVGTHDISQLLPTRTQVLLTYLAVRLLIKLRTFSLAAWRGVLSGTKTCIFIQERLTIVSPAPRFAALDRLA